jgi:hypothetical protein
MITQRSPTRRTMPACPNHPILERAAPMPVYGYEIDNGDPPGEEGVGAATTPTGAAHVAASDLTPVAAGLDANMQVLQAQEVEDVTTFARTANLTAPNTPVWPRFKNDGSDSTEMSLGPC